MDEVQTGRTPIHLWIVGVVSLIWNSFGAYDYLMTRMRNMDYLASMMPGVDPNVVLNWVDSFPIWAQFGWGLGVWSAIIGSILLLMRSRWAFIAFGLSLLGMAMSLGYQILAAPPPPELNVGAMAFMPYVIILVGVALFYYAYMQRQKGVLR